MWTYTVTDAYPQIILHDCEITTLVFEDSAVVFHFADGFWISPEHPHNPHGNLCLTGASQMTFEGCDPTQVQAYLLRRDRRKKEIWHRRELSLRELKAGIGRNRWRVEVVDEYHGTGRALLRGMVSHLPGHWNPEWEMELFFSRITYSWNEVMADRVW